MNDAQGGLDAIVIGAGIAGLAAARLFDDSGRGSIVIDKGRSVGGRLATRRMGGATLDHGAQFFTVRGDTFASEIAEATTDGVVYEWCKGFDGPGDGFTRHACRGGMNQLAKWFAARLYGTPSTATQATAIVPCAEGFEVRVGDEVCAVAPVVVLTAPVAQSLALVGAGDIALAPAVATRLESIEYFATLGLLATLDGPPTVAPSGGEQHDSGPFTFVADNQRKGISEVPALTCHADHDYSLARYDDDPDEVLAELIDAAAPWIGDASIVEAQLKKWRYAGPVEPLAERCLVDEQSTGRLIFAGDAFGGPKVEGAYNSGVAAAAAALAF